MSDVERSMVIEQAEFIASEGTLFNTSPAESERLFTALMRGRGDLLPLGYFRSNIRGEGVPSDQDRAFLAENFGDPDSIFLILDATGRDFCTATLYFWRNGLLQTDASCMHRLLIPPGNEQYVESRGGNDAQRTRAVAPEWQENNLPSEFRNTQSIPVGLPPPSGNRKRLVSLAATLFAIVIMGVMIYLDIPSKLFRRSVEDRSGNSDISLQVNRTTAGQIDVSWNKNLLGNPPKATLFITDGAYRRELELNKEQIRSGKIAYFPQSDDIQFRLEVFLDGKRSIGESVWVVAPGNSLTHADSMAPSKYLSKAQEMLSPSKLSGDMVAGQTRAGSRLAGVQKPQATAKPASLARSPIRIKTPEAPLTLVVSTPPKTFTILPGPVFSPPEIGMQPAGTLALLVAHTQTRGAVVPPPPAPDQTTPDSKNENSEPALVPAHSQSGRQQAVSPTASVSAADQASRPLAIITQPPQPLTHVLPNVKPFGFSIVLGDIEIDVEVAIDTAGRVTAAKATGSVPSRNSLLTAQAIAAAKQWRFKPAERKGVAVPSTYLIKFKFRSPE
jgi:TonB family protein